jgi:hypothetical protein
LLALQNGLIHQGQLLAAFQAWTLDKSKSLADHLEARGDLTGAKRALLEEAGAHTRAQLEGPRRQRLQRSGRAPRGRQDPAEARKSRM